MALLRSLFGAGVEKVKLEHRTFKTPSDKKIELTTIGSNYHIEMNPGDAGIYDTFVVQEVVKEMAAYHPLNTTSQKSFKVVVLMEADRMTKNAQAALRRTMEKYSSSCRLILCVSSPCKVMEAVRSRCLNVRVPAPTHDEICNVLSNVCRRESVQLPQQLAFRVSQAAGRNLRRALLMLEACRVQQPVLTADQPIPGADWEQFIAELARDITKEQTPAKLMAARGKLYELLANCIPPEVIMKTLVRELLRCCDSQLRRDIVHWAAYYEHRMVCGSKEIFHLEAFVAKFMALYKRYMLATFDFEMPVFEDDEFA